MFPSFRIIVIIFFVLSMIMSSYATFLLYKNLPNKNEKLKLIIPILIAIVIGVLFYFLGWYPLSVKFGKLL